MKKISLRAAVDIGGTFTDVTLSDPETGALVSVKTLTTPNDRAEGVLTGITAVLKAAGETEDRVREVIHGSTTGTNALIERSGARVGLLTTAGFRDVLEIGRIQRPMSGLYNVNVDRPRPLVPRYLCLEASERITADGEILTPLEEDSVRVAAEKFLAEGVEAVAVSFLFSYLNPRHEQRASEILAEVMGDIPVTLSSKVAPEYREYERTSTAVMNAYLTPIMNAYLDDLAPRLNKLLGGARLSIIQANGGSTSVDVARAKAVTTVNSGPAGGVVAAAFYGRRHNREKIVSVDMGGTSFDIGLIENGESQVTTEGDFQGLPVKIQIIDLNIIGAGGGSIAWRDSGGAPNVGPYSAGSDPGPACYGRGGNKPTVTDANLVLGRLNPEYFNAGNMALDAEASRVVIGEFAKSLGLGVEEAAIGILKVVNANMIKGIAASTIQRGIDVRDFSLFSFGGAGGVHAADLAKELNMVEAIVPPMAGTFSAVGLLVTESRQDYVRALGNVTTDSADTATLELIYQELEAKGAKDLAAQDFASEEIELIRYADLKVKGQTYELNLALPFSGAFDQNGMETLVEAFGTLYRSRYAFFFEGEPIEIVNLRLTALGRNAPVQLPAGKDLGDNPKTVQTGSRDVYFETIGYIDTATYDRDNLGIGMKISGPAIIEEQTSSTLIPPGATTEVASDLGLIIRFDKNEESL
ncbi:MAG: hydantoinase/oxoprolinase family protein [Rhodospirillaceae bacterium]|nr:hydantoinase/oxoprolinase family protein [Rhodospirillaceae bacterium]MBT5939420.1 hydantoinase/oxoprolinase family protein [Rhodospirillaceae bacterium]MBT7266647.1 hydantoinase/oxoprolinase family protein [Rhodospirillaceae bacterium]